jgi:hypothetical protein
VTSDEVSERPIHDDSANAILDFRESENPNPKWSGLLLIDHFGALIEKFAKGTSTAVYDSVSSVTSVELD